MNVHGILKSLLTQVELTFSLPQKSDNKTRIRSLGDETVSVK